MRLADYLHVHGLRVVKFPINHILTGTPAQIEQAFTQLMDLLLPFLLARVLSDDQGGPRAWSVRRVVDGLRVGGGRLGRALISEKDTVPPPSSPGHRGSLQASRSCARTGRIGRCVQSYALL